MSEDIDPFEAELILFDEGQVFSGPLELELGESAFAVQTPAVEDDSLEAEPTIRAGRRRARRGE